jgi:hypothetical protein
LSAEAVPEVGRRILLRAATLVESGWTQGAEARTSDGTVVDPWEQTAVAWSLLGAIVAAIEEHPDPEAELPLAALAMALGALADAVDDDSLAGWNDVATRSQADATHVLRAAAVRVG